MKKSLFILFIFSALLYSCSKDAKINRRIDGEWKVSSIGGESLPTNESSTFKFSKDKKTTGSGTYTFTDTFEPSTISLPFTYTIGSEKITLVILGSSEVLIVNKYEKDNLELIDSDNNLWVLDPK
jgi:hypothetical protein